MHLLKHLYPKPVSQIESTVKESRLDLKNSFSSHKVLPFLRQIGVCLHFENGTAIEKRIRCATPKKNIGALFGFRWIHTMQREWKQGTTFFENESRYSVFEVGLLFKSTTFISMKSSLTFQVLLHLGSYYFGAYIIIEFLLLLYKYIGKNRIHHRHITCIYVQWKY